MSWLINTLPAVGKDRAKLTFGDFVVKSEAGLVDQYSVQVFLYDDAGQEAGIYSYVDQSAIDGNGWTCEPGWYTTESLEDWSFVAADNTLIPFGQGFMIISNCGASLVCSGEVLSISADVEIASQATSGGVTWTGNCSPVDLTFNDISIVNEAGLVDQYSVQVFLYDDAGQEAGIYSYVDQNAIDGNGWTCEPGWYTTESLEDWSFIAAGNVDIKAGQMVMIISNCGAVWSVPSAL